MSKNNQAKRKAKKKLRVLKLRKEEQRRTKKRLPVLNHDIRQCGECTACCTAMEVVEMGKPMWQRCGYECEAGCAIYENRPESCQEWDCFWRADGKEHVMNEHERPDKTGVLVEICHAEGSERLVVVREVREGGADSPKAKALIQRFAGISLTATMRFGASTPSISGPEDEVREFMKNGKLVEITPDGPKTLWKAGKENDNAA